MPVTVNSEIVRLTQSEFSDVVYSLMSEVFLLHNEMGSLFNEQVYHKILKKRVSNLETEVMITVSFKHFSKKYYIDLLAAKGAILELKSVAKLNTSHRIQLLNYLLLTSLNHGKLINFGSRRVEHEFINTTITQEERKSFTVDDSQWKVSEGFNSSSKQLLTEAVSDWGTCLIRPLYKEAFLSLLGITCPDTHKIEIYQLSEIIASQHIPLFSQNTAIKVTTLEHDLTTYHKDLSKFLNHTTLETIQWINIARKKVTFTTLTKPCS